MTNAQAIAFLSQAWSAKNAPSSLSLWSKNAAREPSARHSRLALRHYTA